MIPITISNKTYDLEILSREDLLRLKLVLEQRALVLKEKNNQDRFVNDEYKAIACIIRDKKLRKIGQQIMLVCTAISLERQRAIRNA